MKLAIIAAGDSSRLKAEGLGSHKALIQIGKENIIERNIRIARQAGFSQIAVIINDHSPELKDYLMRDHGIEIELLVKSTLSSMHSLFELSSLLAGNDFLLSTCDSVYSQSEFNSFIRYAQNKNADGVLAITRFIDDEKPLYAVTGSDGRITALNDHAEASSSVTGGLYYLSPSVFGLINTAIALNTCRLRNFLRMLIDNGFRLYGYNFSKIIDVDHIRDIEEAKKYLITIGPERKQTA
ncbi:MAG: nucleotidyltransferase family protein [Bacteroidota bacterium]